MFHTDPYFVQAEVAYRRDRGRVTTGTPRTAPARRGAVLLRRGRRR